MWVEAFTTMSQTAKDAGYLPKALDIGIAHYVGSPSFADADIYFQVMIKPDLPELSKRQFLELLAGIEANNQTYDRWRAKKDHQSLKAAVDNMLGSEFNAVQFPNFMHSIAEEPPTVSCEVEDTPF
jgi:hypothetical protein